MFSSEDLLCASNFTILTDTTVSVTLIIHFVRSFCIFKITLPLSLAARIFVIIFSHHKNIMLSEF